MCDFCIDGHSEVDDDSLLKCTSFSMDFFSRLVFAGFVNCRILFFTGRETVSFDFDGIK
jgi:hypothetical protein